jgi:hypothetical protein
VSSTVSRQQKFTSLQKNLFIAHRVEERTNEEKVFAYDTHTRAERYHLFREEAKGEWVLAEPMERDYWEALSRSKIARQPQIRDNIIEVMRANPAKSFEQIAQDIGNWCSARTIVRWIVQHRPTRSRHDQTSAGKCTLDCERRARGTGS